MNKILKIATLASTLVTSVAFSQCADISVAGVWDAVNTGTNPVVSTMANPLSGTCSMEVPVTTGKRYVQDDMSQELSFRGTFQIDPNSIDIPTAGSGRKIKVHNVQCAGGCAANSGTDWWQAKLRQNPDGYKLGIWVQEADGTKPSATFDLVDGCNTIEYQLIAGNPGTYKLWINNSVEGSPDLELTNLDFTGRYTDRVRLGRMGQGLNINANATGEVFYSDTFESRRQTFIGNTCL